MEQIEVVAQAKEIGFDCIEFEGMEDPIRGMTVGPEGAPATFPPHRRPYVSYHIWNTSNDHKRCSSLPLFRPT